VIFISGCKTTPLDPIYDTYPKLGFDPIESANYELIKVVNWDNPNPSSAVSFITSNNTFMVDTGSLSHTLLDNKGNWISSYNRGYGEELISGVYFAKDYYVDWPLTGDETKKQYSKHIHGSTLSKTEFNQYLDRAERIVYTILLQYEPEKNLARCLLKIDGNWLLIETELPKSEDRGVTKETQSRNAFMYGTTMKRGETFLKIENEIIPWYKWKDSTNPIYIEADKRRKKSGLRFSSSQVETGWDSTGYYNLKIDNESLKFKAFAFEWKRTDTFDTDMALYVHPDFPQLIILIVSINKGDSMGKVDKDPKEAGIYVIRKKENRAEIH